MNSVIHFELQVDDLERAKNFYSEALGWEFQAWPMEGGEPYVGIITKKEGGDGINGGMVKRPAGALAPEQGTNAYVCTVGTDDFDATAKKIEDAGGRVALEKFAIPGMAWQGYFLDTEGNTFGVHEPNENAK